MSRLYLKSKPPSSTERSGTATWKLYLAGFLGGIVLAIGDLASNDTSSTALKLSAVMQKVIPDLTNGGLVGLLLVGVLGAVLCWVWPVASKGDAFARGFSVFAILTVGTPFKVVQNDLPKQKLTAASTVSRQASQQGLISSAVAADSADPVPAPTVPSDAPSAIVQVTQDISSCRPQYWGLFGLGSLINNSLEGCATGHFVTPGTKVKILSCWDSGFRGYRYLQIAYVWSQDQRIGWALSGRAPTYWQFISPEAESFSRLPQSCA